MKRDHKKKVERDLGVVDDDIHEAGEWNGSRDVMFEPCLNSILIKNILFNDESIYDCTSNEKDKTF